MMRRMPSNVEKADLIQVGLVAEPVGLDHKGLVQAEGSDQFHFEFQRQAGDFDVRVRVAS